MLTNIVNTIFGSFSTVLTTLAEAVKTSFENLLYVDPEATTKQLSDFAQFGFVMMGISIAMGIGYLCVNLIRRKI